MMDVRDPLHPDMRLDRNPLLLVQPGDCGPILETAGWQQLEAAHTRGYQTESIGGIWPR